MKKPLSFLRRWPLLSSLAHGCGITAGSLVGLGLMVGLAPQGQASVQRFRGLIELDYGSSLVGAPKNSRYFVDFSLDDAVLDTDHTVFENATVNQNGEHGLTTTGVFDKPFLSLSLVHDPSSVGGLDLTGLHFDLANANANFARVVDVNEPPNPQAPPCDSAPCINEHITLMLRDTTPGAPVNHVWFNFYNSNFYNPVYASRQLLLDTSASGIPFTLGELFLHGPQTLAEFQSYRTPNIAELHDVVLLTGPNGTVASGRFLRLTAIAASPAPLPLLGIGAALGHSRRLRQRLQGSRP